VSNRSNYYVCTVPGTSAGSGGPSGQAYGIIDGTCGWDFVAVTSSTGATVLADFSVGTSVGFDFLIGATNVQVGTSVTCTQLAIMVPIS
jgi:hypothetical protein